MNNIPQVKLGIVAVSRDCFPIQLSQNRRAAVVAACAAKGLEVYEAQTTVENEKDMLTAVEEVTKAGCNALTVCSWATLALKPPKPLSPRTLTAPACSWLPPRATAT